MIFLNWYVLHINLEVLGNRTEDDVAIVCFNRNLNTFTSGNDKTASLQEMNNKNFGNCSRTEEK